MHTSGSASSRAAGSGRRGRLGVALVVAGILSGAGTLLGWPIGLAAQRPPRVGEPAAEISGGPWIGSEPLSLARLRGRVVLVEFWTYG
jgi:hypothetical protein